MKDLREHVTLCELEDGTIVTYDAMSSVSSDVYDPTVFKYIGQGHVYSFDGVLQSNLGQTEYFFQRINPHVETPHLKS